MLYDIRFPTASIPTRRELQKAALLNAGGLEPIDFNTFVWIDIPESEVPRVIDYIFLEFMPPYVELIGQYTHDFGTVYRTVCYIKDCRKYATVDPFDLSRYIDLLMQDTPANSLTRQQYREMTDDLNYGNMAGVHVAELTRLIREHLNPNDTDRLIHDILCDMSDIYHHEEEYVDDPSTITYEPEADYFARWMEEH
jgi:hypothetical protein